MQPTKPFLFDRCFEAETGSTQEASPPTHPAAAKRSSKAKRYYDEEDLNRARAEARNEATVEFETTEQRRLAKACDSVANSLKETELLISEFKENITNECTLLAIAISKKLFITSDKNNKSAEIENMVLSVLPNVFDNHKIEVKVDQNIAPHIQEILAPLIKASGFSQQINVVADQDMSDGDCVVEWPGGGASRNQREIWQQLNAIIERMTEQSLSDLDDTAPLPSRGERETLCESSG